MAKKINDLFGVSRWVLPEQRAALLAHNEVRGLEARPEIDEMCFRIYDSTQYDYAINVKGDLGTFESAWGVVREIDPQRERFKLANDWDAHWINVRDLVAVTK